MLWILYLAIELFLRRRWPQVLVSWTRLLSGDLRDPRIARDALAGCARGVLMMILAFLRIFVPQWLEHPEPAPWAAHYLTAGGFYISEIPESFCRACKSAISISHSESSGSA
jgi:hypothetical protein